MRAIKRYYIPCVHCAGTGKVLSDATGQEMRTLRKEYELSLRDLAKLIGYSAAYVSDLELGRKKCNERLIRKYMEALKR